MNEVRSKGYILSIFTYFICGLVFIFTFKLISTDYNANFATATIVMWMFSFFLLCFLIFSDRNLRRFYEPLYVICGAVFGLLVQLFWNAPYLLYLIFAIEWLLVLSFLRKKVLHELVAAQIICFAFLTFANGSITEFGKYSKISLIFNAAVLIFADWLGGSLISALFVLEETNAEHERSLDDLLEIVEAKHTDAKAATKAKSQFLSSMSHEIRTPINAILGMNEMILRESTEEHILDYAADIKSSSNILLNLINDILDVSKVEAGKMELVTVQFEMNSIIDDVVKMISPKIEDKGLEFIVDIDESLPDGYFGDDVRIRQVLLNILNNAAKYTNEGVIILSMSGEVIDDMASLHFAVKDTGIGIKSEEMKKLSESFVRLDEEKNRRIEGTGLGISIVSALLQLMDSELMVESIYGEGSTFFFTLNLKIGENISIKEARIRERERRYANTARTRKKKEDNKEAGDFPKILVVDDNAVNIKVFKGVLKKSPVSIDSASSGAQALEMAAKVKYRAIFMDHMMPEMDGIETLSRMRANKEYLNIDTPVIALTANAIAGAREMYEEKGFCDFISKPFDAEKLIGYVGELVKKPENL